LFDRSNKRRLKLTSAGEAFLHEACLIIAQVDRAIEVVQQIGRGEIGKLIIGFNSSVSNSILPDIIRSFYYQFPHGELDLRESTAHSLIESLKMQQIDLGLMHWSNSYEINDILSVETIREEHLMLVLPEDHPLASESEISLQSLANESFILPPSYLSYSLYEPIISFCKQVGFVPNITQEFTFMLTILNLVAGGFGITVLPANVQNLQRRGVVYRRIKEPTPTVQIVAAWRRDNASIILQNFLNLLKEI
jgi:DNA-binding transcriptional LysR family regulator